MRTSTFLLACCLMAATAWATNPLETDCGDNVQITATPTTGYHFVKWQKGGADFEGNDVNPLTITSVDASATYRAFFAINQYTITFKNWNDTVLQTATYNHGEAVTAPVATKTADAQYTYTFSGWTPNVSYTATGEATYTAQFTETLNKYTVTFKNWDGTELQSSEWVYGQPPTYNGASDPTRPADAENTYTFIGWDATIVPVTGDAIYTAVYSNMTNSYTITVNAGEGGSVTGGGLFTYGTSVTITAAPNECYEFVKWSDNDTNQSRTFSVSGDMNVTAEFRKIKYTITVETDDASQGTVDAVKVP